MRIFYFCYEDLETQAAGMIHIREITENLQKLGHDVILFAPDNEKRQYKTTVPVIYVPLVNIRLLKEYTYYFFLFFYFIFYNKQKKTDIIYVREMALSLVPVMLAKLFNVPYILEVNGLISGDFASIKTSSLKNRLYTFFQKFNTRTANAIIVPAKHIKSTLIKSFCISPKRLFLVQNGVNIDKFYPSDKKLCQKKLNLSHDYNYIIFVGRFYPHHGLIEFLYVFKYILKENNKIKFIMTGDGYLRKEVEKLVDYLELSDYVISEGEVQNELVPLYINASDIGLVLLTGANRHLLNPIKLYEYWACSKPIITNNNTAISNEVKNINAGIIINLKESEHSAKAIASEFSNKLMLEERGKNGLRNVKSNNSWKVAAEKIEDVIKLSLRNQATTIN